MERLAILFFQNTLFSSFASYMTQKKHITLHIIISSKSFIMMCAATIFTTRRTMETSNSLILGYMFMLHLVVNAEG